NVGIALLTAVGVYWVPNLDGGIRRYAKAAVAVAGTALQALVPFLAEGTVTPAQWLLVLLAGLCAVAVGIVLNDTPRKTDHSISVFYTKLILTAALPPR